MSQTFKQQIKQLPPRKGAYYYVSVASNVVDGYPEKRHTRLVCTIDNKVKINCGLNHLGNGDYFIIVAAKHLKTVDKKLGDTVTFTLREDPNPLGVEIPEALQALLEQDVAARKTWEAITDGKKRSLIYTIGKLKDMDILVQRSLAFLEKELLNLDKKMGG